MIFIVTSVRDVIAEQFKDLNLELNDDTARRNFESAVIRSQDTQSGVLYTHPGDFVLYKVGEFNTASGILEPLPLTVLAHGDEFLE